MFRSTSLRVAALYTAVFALSVVVLGIITLFSTRQALSEQFDARIRAEAAALVQEYRSEGLQGVVDAVHERDNTPGSLDFGLQGPRVSPWPDGWPRSAPAWAGRPFAGAPTGAGSRSGSSRFPCLTATNSWSATTRSASKRSMGR